MGISMMRIGVLRPKTIWITRQGRTEVRQMRQKRKGKAMKRVKRNGRRIKVQQEGSDELVERKRDRKKQKKTRQRDPKTQRERPKE